MIQVRELTADGLEVFANYLLELRGDPSAPPPFDILDNPAFALDLGHDLSVEFRAFSSKYVASEYFHTQFGSAKDLVVENRSMWAWLSLFYLDVLLPPTATGTRKVRESAKYLPSEDHYRQYRHLLQGPYKLFAAHGNGARLFLEKPMPVWSDVEEQLVSIRELIRMPSAMAAADILYFDKGRNRAKVGITTKDKPGGIRRFGSIIQQFDLTYDLYSMTGEEIVQLLPSEFDGFRAA